MKNASKKAIVLLLVVVLLIGCVAGGTLAYLIATPKTVTNTFTPGDVGDLGLTETTGTSYLVVPGVEIEKDPVVSFGGNNIPAYVFLKVDATGWTVTEADGKYTYSIGSGEAKMEWVLASGWTKHVDGVYYKAVGANNTESWHVIDGDKITVGTGITEDIIANYTKSLTFTAYAVQQAAFNGNIADAWTAAQQG